MSFSVCCLYVGVGGGCVISIVKHIERLSGKRLYTDVFIIILLFNKIKILEHMCSNAWI